MTDPIPTNETRSEPASGAANPPEKKLLPLPIRIGILLVGLAVIFRNELAPLFKPEDPTLVALRDHGVAAFCLPDSQETTEYIQRGRRGKEYRLYCTYDTPQGPMRGSFVVDFNAKALVDELNYAADIDRMLGPDRMIDPAAHRERLEAKFRNRLTVTYLPESPAHVVFGDVRTQR